MEKREWILAIALKVTTWTDAITPIVQLNFFLQIECRLIFYLNLAARRSLLILVGSFLLPMNPVHGKCTIHADLKHNIHSNWAKMTNEFFAYALIRLSISFLSAATALLVQWASMTNTKSFFFLLLFMFQVAMHYSVPKKQQQSAGIVSRIAIVYFAQNGHWTQWSTEWRAFVIINNIQSMLRTGE